MKEYKTMRYYVDITIDQGYFVADSHEEAIKMALQSAKNLGVGVEIYDTEPEEEGDR